MRREISERIRKRAIVFPSGFEVKRGMIQDTNSPYIRDRLMKEGYSVTIGEVLEDEMEGIVPVLRRALNEGYGLIITTGGVGAEDKDRMVEALLRLDPEASTPYIIHYEKGKGRHEKDGVKIGVAYLHPSYLIALPGPHEEVIAGIEVIVEGLKKGTGERGNCFSPFKGIHRTSEKNSPHVMNLRAKTGVFSPLILASMRSTTSLVGSRFAVHRRNGFRS